MRLSVVDGELAVCRLAPTAELPRDVLAGEFAAVVRTADELSIVCPVDRVPEGATVEAPWRALKVAGPLDFWMVGVIASITEPLAAAGISALVIATFDTDHVLVRALELDRAVAALRTGGHEVA